MISVYNLLKATFSTITHRVPNLISSHIFLPPVNRYWCNKAPLGGRKSHHWDATHNCMMLTCKYVPSIWRIKEALKAKVTSGISNKMADDCKLLQVIILLLLYWHILTYQVECFAVWFNFMFFHVLYKAAVCVSVGENYINGMPSVDLSCITIIKWVKITQSTQKCLNQQTCFALILKRKKRKEKK